MTTTAFRLSTGRFAQDWTNTAPTADFSGVPSIMAYGIDAPGTGTGDASTYFTDFSTQATFGTNSNGNPSAGGAYSYTGANPTFAFQGSGSQDYVALEFFLDSTGRQNVTFQANIRDLDPTDNTTQQVQVQYRIGGTGTWTNVPGGYIADATSTGATLVTPISVTLPSAADNQAVLQIRVLTANAPGSDELIGVDDIVIDSAPLVANTAGSFAIAGASVTEGDSGTTPIAFAIARTGGASGAADIAYSITLPGGATGASASDFAAGTPLSGIVHFNDGQTTGSIVLNILGDTTYEQNENFTVNLTGTNAGTITTASATGTILNDDAQPPVGALSIANASVAEGDSGVATMLFTVTRANGTLGAISADYAVNLNGTANAADLTGPLTGTVAFADGETSKQIAVQVVGDTVYEANETFSVTLTNPTGGATIAAATATGTILNDDPVPPLAPLFINELHYDNIGTDSGEAIEIVGPAGTDLTGWKIYLYNGGDGATYGTPFALTGTIADQSNGYGTVVATYPSNGIQNGSPDGIALVAPDGTVVQFLSYEGVMTAANGPAAGQTSTDIGVSEESVPVGYSLQLSGTGANYADYNWTQAKANTFGQINTGQTFLPATGPGYVRIGDASVTEGDTGTHAMNFVVTRSGGGAAAASVDYAVNFNGTASASDIAANTPLTGTVSFAIGETVKTITINVVGDTLSEPNETFGITLSNPTGNTFITDGTAVGTIINDDPIALHTYEIQGASHTSDYVGQKVTTTGIVTAVGTAGFYVQDPTGDGNGATSDAIFVATSGRASVVVGDAVSVSGTVAEVGSSGALTVTQMATATFTVTSHDNALPAAVLIGVDGLLPPTSVIDDDNFTVFDPQHDGIDFYESLEGMRVTVETPMAVATTVAGETWVVASGGVGATGINAHGGITISAGDYNPERILLDSATDIYSGFTGSYTQGDRLSNVTGVFTYNSFTYKLEVTDPVTLTQDVALQPEITNLRGDATHLTIASFNMENADVGDGAAKFNLLAQTVVYNLQAPTIIFAQEIQDADGAGAGTDYTGTATANALIAAVDALGGPHYTYVEVAPTANNTTGGEPNGNIRNGYFYDSSRVSYITGSAKLLTDAAFDGSRKPLVADFLFNGQVITAIDMHSTSRLGSDSLYGATQPPVDGGDGSRTAQALAVKAYVDGVLANDPTHNIVVGGDFNGFYFETALATLGSNGLTNLNALIPAEERYSYVFDGNLQQIDNILATGSLFANAEFDAVHINTLKAAGDPQATDHDQVIARFAIPAANHAPVGVDDAVAVNEDATSANLYATLLGNDTDADGNPLTIVGVDTTGLQGHVVFDAATHSLQYIADADAFDTLKTGATAIDTFTYTVSDGTLTSTARVSVTVTGVDDGVDQFGTSNGDVLSGTAADDRIFGYAGNDRISGGAGADFVSGGIGNDTINGDAGNDTLLGGAGADTINGGDGNDYISGDAGNDILTGGAGADTFAFGQNGGKDIILDFDIGIDRILLANGLSVVSSTVGDTNRDGIVDTTIVFSSGSSAVLMGVNDFAAVHIDRTPDPLVTDPVF